MRFVHEKWNGKWIFDVLPLPKVVMHESEIKGVRVKGEGKGEGNWIGLCLLFGSKVAFQRCGDDCLGEGEGDESGTIQAGLFYAKTG